MLSHKIFLVSLGLVAHATSAIAAKLDSELKLNTPMGVFQGERHEGTIKFPNIAYAKPPIQENRWKRVPLETKARQLEAGVACPQTVFDSIPGEVLPLTEDCLYMNIWAPENAQNLPVIFLIHGGGLLAGSGLKSFYNGSVFARRNFVFVSFNYRLSEFGYGPHLNKEPGSLGLMDQSNALNWTIRNISNFGGDPDNIFLMGHSRGAEAVLALMETGLAGSNVKGGIAFSGIRHFSPGANKFLEKEQTDFVPSFHNRDWKSILTDRGFTIFTPELPDVISKRTDDHKYNLLVSVLYDETLGGKQEEVYCGHAFFLKQLYDYIVPYFYVWHPGSREHGSEMQGIFSEDIMGKKILNLIEYFVENGHPPRTFLGGSLPPFREKMEVRHEYPYFSFDLAFVDKWNKTNCNSSDEIVGSSISKSLMFLEKMTRFLGNRKYDEELKKFSAPIPNL